MYKYKYIYILLFYLREIWGEKGVGNSVIKKS